MSSPPNPPKDSAVQRTAISVASARIVDRMDCLESPAGTGAWTEHSVPNLLLINIMRSQYLGSENRKACLWDSASRKF